jgi:hypothetical protein
MVTAIVSTIATMFVTFFAKTMLAMARKTVICIVFSFALNNKNKI